MRLVAHNLFSWGLLSALCSPLTLYLNATTGSTLYAYYMWLGLGLISVIVNTLIDRLGHRWLVLASGQEVPARIPRTHSLGGALAVGALTSGLLYVALILFALAVGGSISGLQEEVGAMLVGLIVMGLGALVGLTHLFLDALTMRGIYVKRQGKWVRWALAHWRYDTPMNTVFALTGFILMMATSPLFIGFL